MKINPNEPAYQHDKIGRLKRMRKSTSMKDRILLRSEPIPESGCWIWIGALQTVGYGYLRVGNANLGAHRVSYEAFNGPIPKGLRVLHTCDVRECVNPSHLFIGDAADNSRDALCKKRIAAQKLTPDDVREIRASNGRNVDVARSYGITADHVWKIRTRRSWAWLP